MTLEDLAAGISSIGVPVAYGEFITSAETPAPAPPFITYQVYTTQSIAADNRNYLNILTIYIEVYCARKDMDVERLLQAKLNDMGLIYNIINEQWLDADRLRQVTYSTQIIVS